MIKLYIKFIPLSHADGSLMRLSHEGFRLGMFRPVLTVLVRHPGSVDPLWCPRFWRTLHLSTVTIEKRLEFCNCSARGLGWWEFQWECEGLAGKCWEELTFHLSRSKNMKKQQTHRKCTPNSGASPVKSCATARILGLPPKSHEPTGSSNESSVFTGIAGGHTLIIYYYISCICKFIVYIYTYIIRYNNMEYVNHIQS